MEFKVTAQARAGRELGLNKTEMPKLRVMMTEWWYNVTVRRRARDSTTGFDRVRNNPVTKP